MIDCIAVRLKQFGNPNLKVYFFSRMVKDKLSIEPGQKSNPLSVKEVGLPVTSEKDNLMMFLGGFKDAVINHGGEIREFQLS